MRDIKLHDGTMMPKLLAETYFRRVGLAYKNYPTEIEAIALVLANNHELKFGADGSLQLNFSIPKKIAQMFPSELEGYLFLEKQGIISNFASISDDENVKDRKPALDYFSYTVSKGYVAIIRNSIKKIYNTEKVKFAILVPSIDHAFQDKSEPERTSSVREFELKDGFFASAKRVEKYRSLLADLFDKYPIAMHDVCQRIIDIGDDRVIMPHRKQPHMIGCYEAELADFYSLEIEGAIMNFRLNEPRLLAEEEEIDLDNPPKPFTTEYPKDEIVGTAKEREHNDFYFYEVDPFLARIVRNCVQFEKTEEGFDYKILNPFKHPEKIARREAESYTYSR